MQLQPVYFLYHLRFKRFIGKRNPTYAVMSGDGSTPDAHWWAERQDGARAWTGLDGVRRFLCLCDRSKLSHFLVLGTDGSEQRADALVQSQAEPE